MEMTDTKELNAVEEKSKRLEDLYMVIGALMFMAAALRNIGTVAHTERAKQCEALANYYDSQFVAEINDLSLPRATPDSKQAGSAEEDEGVK